MKESPVADSAINIRTCYSCGCTETDCRQCIAKTGNPCYWVSEDLCSACTTLPAQVKAFFQPKGDPGRQFTMTFTTHLTPGMEKTMAADTVKKVLQETCLAEMIVTRVDVDFTHLTAGRFGLPDTNPNNV